MASGVYSYWHQTIGRGEITLGTDTLKAALMSDSHVFDPDDDGFGDISANEIAGTGYTAGGVALTGVDITVSTTSDLVRIVCDPIEWAGATFTAYHLVVYCDDHINDTLLCSIDLGGAQSAVAGTFTVTAASGLVTFSNA